MKLHMTKYDSIKHFLESGSLVSVNPNEVLLGWGERQLLSSIEGITEPTFYFPDFFLEDKTPFVLYSETQIISINELQDALRDFSSSQVSLKWLHPASECFYQEFDRVQALFKEKKLLKAVPYAFSKTQQNMNVVLLANSLFNLLSMYKDHSVFLYGNWDKKEGILGATPELLFQYDQNILETAAVAGTDTDRERLLKSEKEKIEHQVVVDDLRHQLSKLGKVSEGKTEVLSYHSLYHLFTPINAKITHNLKFEQIVKIMHPTPALGAYPRKEGMQWLKSYQTRIPRNRFGAPAGYYHRNTGKCYVAIRNMQWNNHEIMIGAGCGIVKQSQKEQEWKEINLKIAATKQMLAL